MTEFTRACNISSDSPDVICKKATIKQFDSLERSYAKTSSTFYLTFKGNVPVRLGVMIETFNLKSLHQPGPPIR